MIVSKLLTFLTFKAAHHILDRAETRIHGDKNTLAASHPLYRLRKAMKILKKKRYELSQMCNLALRLFNVSEPSISKDTAANFTIDIHEGAWLQATAATETYKLMGEVAVGLAANPRNELIMLFPNGNLHIGCYWTTLDKLLDKIQTGVDLNSCVPHTNTTYDDVVYAIARMVGCMDMLKIALLEKIDTWRI